MKKKTVSVMLLAGALSAVVMLPGCGKSAGKALEYKELGITQMEQGDFSAAAESFQNALDQSGRRIGAKELDISFYKALALYKAGDIDQAIATYTSMIEYDEDNWETYYLRGNLYLESGQNQAAIGDYKKAAELNAADTRLYVNLYENLTEAGEQDAAEKYESDVLNSSPSKAADYYYVGDMYYLTGDYDNAVTNLKSAVDGGYDEALLLLGRAYSAMGDKDDAKAAYSSYMEKYPDDAAALNELGVTAIATEDYENAVDYLETALESAEGDIALSIKKNLIAAYEYSGNFRKAYSTARDLASKTDDEEVAREYQFLRTRISYDNQNNGIQAGAEEEGTIEGAVIPDSGQ